MTSDEIREAFLSYFESKGHQRVASSSLIPIGDPTLLLTNAGMVQFKPYFSGEATPPSKRLASSQKSFRTVDIDEVGDATHLTLFEMLGNFSIGDYFKEGSVKYALECLTSVMGLPQERFAATIHDSDDEAFEIWRNVGVPDERVYRFGDADNWWGPAGLEGPCGPCSELHYDFGPDAGCRNADCAPNCQNTIVGSNEACHRFVELWNLVFMQYHHHLDGTRTSLPTPSVDTGMGLERLAAIMQGSQSVYDSDIFTPLLHRVEEIGDFEYDADSNSSYAARVVAEHGRSATFLIADGVVPGNEGRGYVLRRVIRRAIRHGRNIRLADRFLGEIARVVIDKMEIAYPELRAHQDFIQTVLNLEEERFQQAFQNGYSILDGVLKKGGTVAGDVVFSLWDTYGFPVEVTREIALEKGVDVDVEGFEREMNAQRDRGRSAGRFDGDRAKIRLYESLGIRSTGFMGYERLAASSVVVGLISGSQIVNEVHEGDEVEVMLQQTSFYPEGGGQVGDTGMLVGSTSRIDVSDTQHVMPELIVHFGKVAEGTVTVGDTIDARVDAVRREDTARNHTATHLLHAALRQVLGAHVRQSGSLVAPDRLRFDFSHVESVTVDEIQHVEWLVNERIRQNVKVHKSEDTYSSAMERGALAFFGDKYGESVRLVEVANGVAFSLEVCGGTHVERTGELGAVHILGESSIGAGMRRIDAVSGRGAERLIRDRFNTENAVSTMLQVPIGKIEDRVQGLLDELNDLRSKNAALERRLSLQAAEGLLDSKRDVDGVSVLAEVVSAYNVDALREMGDWLRDKLGSAVVVLGSVVGDRPVLIVMVTADLVEIGLSASEIAKGAAKAIGGGGGGKPDMAQAGGRRTDKLHEAIAMVPDLVRRMDIAF